MLTKNKVALWLCGLVLIGVVILIGNMSVSAISINQNPSLRNASPAQIEQAAIKHINIRLRVFSGTPTVVVNRSITTAELLAVDIPAPTSANPEPPRRLLVLKGDFDLSNLGPSWVMDTSNPKHYSYLLFIYDLTDEAHGAPTMILGSSKGGIFRKVLNNPSLPDDGPTNVEQSPNQDNDVKITPTVSIINPVPYGSAAPPVSTPTR